MTRMFQIKIKDYWLLLFCLCATVYSVSDTDILGRRVFCSLISDELGSVSLSLSVSNTVLSYLCVCLSLSLLPIHPSNCYVYFLDLFTHYLFHLQPQNERCQLIKARMASSELTGEHFQSLEYLVQKCVVLSLINFGCTA